MISFLVHFLLLGLSFVVLPFGSSWYEIPKVIVFWIVTWILVIFSLFNNHSVHKLKVSFLPIILYSALVLFSLYGLLMLPTTTTFFGNTFRLQGVLTFWLLVLVAGILSQQINTKYLQLFAPYSLVALFLTTLAGITDNTGRSVGPVGEANSLGAAALFFFALSILPIQKIRTSTFRFILFLSLTLGVIFFSGSRSTLIGLIAMGIVLFFCKWTSLAKATFVSLVCVVISLCFPFFVPQQTFDSRVEIWRTAVFAGLEKPIAGWGIGNIEQGLLHAAGEKHTPLRFQYVDSSHNVFLDFWVQGGGVGLLLFCVLFSTGLMGLIQKKEKVLVLALIGITSVMLFNPVSISVLVPFYYLLGNGVSVIATQKSVKTPKKKS